MTFLIRPARDEDREALLEQTQLLNLHEEPITGNRRLDRAGAEDTLAAAEARVARSDGAVLVAEAESRVVGHLILTFATAPVYVREELRPYAYIDELFVREDCRGRGLGQALMAEAERIAVERGYRQMIVGVQSGNVSAEAAYARFGFAPFAQELIKRIGVQGNVA
ncbi:MAG: GNAT family N-acetyltransferase [Kiloniellales bacterium]|nr:GNAT family N-acetyltransferase [Kiloniellales bacterium]